MLSFIKKISVLTVFVFGVLSFMATPANAYTLGENSTEEMKVEVVDESDKLNITYTVTEYLGYTERHGIFLLLPKSQDGVWTKYEVKRVERRDPAANSLEYYGGFKPLYKDNYDVIKEWNQFRLRVGDADTNLPIGMYQYEIEIEATKNEDYEYNFILIEDRVGTVPKINVFYDGKSLCDSEIECSDQLTEINLNEGEKAVPLYRKFFYFSWGYLLVATIFYIIITLIWYFFAKDPKGDNSEDSPEFEPPKNLTPWQAQYLIREGGISLEDTLLSYILWLSNKKYIKIKPNYEFQKADKKKRKKMDEVVIEKLKDLPKENKLPAIFNKTVEKMIEKGVKKGLKESKINPSQHQGKLNDEVYQSLKEHYSIKPLNNAVIIAIVLIVVFGFASYFGFEALKWSILIGYSWVVAVIVGLALAIPGAVWLAREWGKLKPESYKLRVLSVSYKLYIDKAEKLKLDFSNNPKEGVQYYLKAVPFAAAFGVLPKFQKYIEKVMPEMEQVRTTDSILTSYAAASFYRPVSTGSGGVGGLSGGSSFSSGGFSGGGGSW